MMDSANFILKIFGLSQNPNTKDYIMVLQDGYCENCGRQYIELTHKQCILCHLKSNVSENEQIDNFIQEIQSKINYNDTMFEWIPYNQLNNIKSNYYTMFEWIPYNRFNNIKEINKDDNTTAYSAVWKDGPLYYGFIKNEFTRKPDEKVTLKCLHSNSQNMINEFLNEIRNNLLEAFSISKRNNIKTLKICGISQHPDTKDYIMILQYVRCKNCGNIHIWYISCHIDYLKRNFTNWTSGDENIDNFIQKKQLETFQPFEMTFGTSNLVFEWIPYNQFNDIKVIVGNNFTTIYSAIWKDGPSSYNSYKKKFTRELDKIVGLKCLCNSTNTTILNEV